MGQYAPFPYKYCMIIGFDIISDLNLIEGDTFDWEGKATSLYCIIPGNISDDLDIFKTTLSTLSKYYQGVFFIDGKLEHNSIKGRTSKCKEINKICKSIKNVVYLHDNVVVVEGIALVGANGWFGNYIPEDALSEIELQVAGYEDTSYLLSTVKKLQLHNDVSKIIVITNSVPLTKLFYGEIPKIYNDCVLSDALEVDTENKVTHWIFANTEKIIDTNFDNINYLNNPCYKRNPYYAKRLDIEF
jgi:predicted phosphohydrolase